MWGDALLPSDALKVGNIIKINTSFLALPLPEYNASQYQIVTGMVNSKFNYLTFCVVREKRTTILRMYGLAIRQAHVCRPLSDGEAKTKAQGLFFFAVDVVM